MARRGADRRRRSCIGNEDWRGASAGLMLGVHHLAQAAVLEADVLAWLDTVEAALKLATHRDVGGVGATVVDAGVALAADPDAEVGLARPGDEDAQVRRHQ